ncbi:MAG: hypothetical protein ACREH4_04975 [Vitreimonas sp.]
MRTLSVILFAIALAACSPPEPPKTAPPPPEHAVAPSTARAEFSAAGGNVGCTYTPRGGTAVYSTHDGRAELFCDRVEPTYVRLSMSEEGAAREVPTDERGCCSGAMLEPGARWSPGPFSCEASEAGVVCGKADGHGFTLTRTQAEVR